MPQNPVGMSHVPVYTDGTLGMERGRKGGKKERKEDRREGGRAQVANWPSRSLCVGSGNSVPASSCVVLTCTTRWALLFSPVVVEETEAWTDDSRSDR